MEARRLVHPAFRHLPADLLFYNVVIWSSRRAIFSEESDFWRSQIEIAEGLLKEFCEKEGKDYSEVYMFACRLGWGRVRYSSPYNLSDKEFIEAWLRERGMRVGHVH